MEHDRWLATATNMIDYGGRFARQIGQAMIAADSGNCERLEQAFPDLMERYKPENWVLVEDHEYVCSVWSERGETTLSLCAPDGREVFSLDTEGVNEAITDGYLVPPRGPLMSSRALNDNAAWQPCAVEYARSMGLIK